MNTYYPFNNSMTDTFISKSNGRVNTDPNIPINYNIVKSNDTQKEFAGNSTTRTYKVNCLSSLYFSQMNIDILQEGLRLRVLNDTNGEFNIGKQNETELKIIMRSIYYQHGKNNMNDIINQTKILNGFVLDWASNEIITNIKQFVNYKNNIGTLPMPMDHGSLVSNKGTKTLELKSFI